MFSCYPSQKIITSIKYYSGNMNEFIRTKSVVRLWRVQRYHVHYYFDTVDTLFCNIERRNDPVDGMLF
jgi:hypothetical protein